MLYTIWYWGGEDEHKLSLAAFEGWFQEQLYKQVKKKRKKKKVIMEKKNNMRIYDFF